MSTVNRRVIPNIAFTRAQGATIYDADGKGYIDYHTAFGSIFLTYFMSGEISSYDDLLRNDVDRFVRYRLGMIERGIYMLPVNLKRNHVSLAHTEADIDATLQASEGVLRAMA